MKEKGDECEEVESGEVENVRIGKEGANVKGKGSGKLFVHPTVVMEFIGPFILLF